MSNPLCVDMFARSARFAFPVRVAKQENPRNDSNTGNDQYPSEG
jgi:hypothetical protein